MISPWPAYRLLESLVSSPPILHALLGIIQPWVQVLGRSLHRLSASAPSFPLVVAGVVPCAWRPADSALCSTAQQGGTMTPGTTAACDPGTSPRAPCSRRMPWGCSAPAAGDSAQPE